MPYKGKGPRPKFCSNACRQAHWRLFTPKAAVVPVGQTVKDKDRVGINRAQRIGKYGAPLGFVTVPISILGGHDAGITRAVRKSAHTQLDLQLDLLLEALGKFRHEGGVS
jgi:hypothetical protein